jgi:hypothetical protein
MSENIHTEALSVWEAFVLFNDAIMRGGDDTDHVAMEAHTQESDNIGAHFMTAYLEVGADSHVIVYMHTMPCHMGDLVRECGGFIKLCSQEAEVMHHMTKFFARKRSTRRGDAF